MGTKIRFQKFAVTNGATKARVHYSMDNRTDGRKCVTIYEKGYEGHLGDLFYGDAGYKNDTDIQTDYFDKGRVVLFEEHPCYAAARARAEMIKAEREARILVTHGMTCNCSECTAIRRAGKPAEEGVPLCVAELGCLCAGHARGDAAEDPCDTRESVREDLVGSEYGRLVASLEGSFRG